MENDQKSKKKSKKSQLNTAKPNINVRVNDKLSDETLDQSLTNLSLDESFGESEHCGDESNVQKSVLKRRNYTLKDKLDMVMQYNPGEAGKGYQALSKKFNVPRSTFQKWVGQKDEFMAALKDPNLKTRQRRRLQGGGRKPGFPALESGVIKFITDRNRQGVRVTDKDIKVFYVKIFLIVKLVFLFNCLWFIFFLGTQFISH